MSNSSLVNYRRWSPNYSSRDGSKIDTITIHHMAGNLSIETCGNVFAGADREASATYGVGTDGRIGQYVDEANRPWTSSSYANDRRAVTIEVANDKIGGDWHVSDKALATTIDLCVDICKRNGIKALNYTGDTSGNLTMHCWFAATACPGPYLKSKFPYIAQEVNRKLGASSAPTPLPTKGIEVDGIAGSETVKALQKYLGTTQDAVISGQNPNMKKYLPNFTAIEYGSGGSLCVTVLQRELTKQGFSTEADGYLGPNTVKALQRYMNKWWGASMTVDGVAGSITITYLQRFLNYKLYNIGETTQQIKAGDYIKVVKPINYDNGKTFKVWYPKYKVMVVSGNRAVIGINNVVTSAVDIKNLKKV